MCAKSHFAIDRLAYDSDRIGRNLLEGETLRPSGADTPEDLLLGVSDPRRTAAAMAKNNFQYNSFKNQFSQCKLIYRLVKIDTWTKINVVYD